MAKIHAQAKKVIRNTLVTIAVVYGCLVAYNAFMDDLLLDVQFVKRVPSPTCNVDAILYTVDAGATTSTSYQVCLVFRGLAINRDNAVLITDRVEDPDRIKLDWKGNNLTISVPNCQVFKQEKSASVLLNHITIDYK